MIEFRVNLKFTCIISLICVLFSICVQYILHEVPCLLCLYTRIGFIVVAILCFVTTYCRGLSWLPFFALVALMCLSFYHLGVENHWWVAPESCKMVLPTLEQLNAKALPSDRPPCDKVGFQIFGISMTLFSFVTTSFLMWLHSIALALKLHK